MTGSSLGGTTAALVVLTMLAACADSPTPFGPTVLPDGGALAFTAPTAGQLIVCKEGNADGTFEFDVSFATTDAAPIAPSTIAVAVGKCVTVVDLGTTGSFHYRATVIEQPLPANWALTGLAIVTQPVGADDPQTYPDMRKAEVNVNNDVGATITFTNTYTPPGCTYTQGYWKTHSEFGPAPYDNTWAQLPSGASTTFFLSGQTYYQVFGTPSSGNAYYILAPQYIAAQLNFLKGAAPAAAQAAYNSAAGLFNVHTPAYIGSLKGSNALRQQFISLAGTLDNYNNGIIGPGHC